MKKSLNIVLFLLLACFVARLASASTPWKEDGVLTASDKGAGDELGRRVSISGSVALVGAKEHNARLGAAYIYVSKDGGKSWPSSETQKLTASDAFGTDELGNDVSVSGNVALVGAARDDSQKGAAYIYVSGDGGKTWPSSETQILAFSDTAGITEIGFAVSVSGNTAFVGSADLAVFVFLTSDGGSTWNQTQKILGGTTGQYFGRALSVSGNIAVIGAYTTPLSGAAYIFVGSNGGATWNQTQKLTPAGLTTYQACGLSVSISGNVAVMGCPGYIVNSIGAGGAFIFTSGDAGATWNEKQVLTLSNPALGDNFGYSVSISGNNVLVGAQLREVGTSSNAGAAYIFQPVGPPSSKPQSSSAAADSDNLANCCS